MFFHYSIILIISKKKQYKTDQKNYNNLFYSIENNLRELGFGDISVNKKMKDLNKIFYDILIKLNNGKKDLRLNKDIFIKYFKNLAQNGDNLKKCEMYFKRFYEFCFDIPPQYMIERIKDFRY